MSWYYQFSVTRTGVRCKHTCTINRSDNIAPLNKLLLLNSKSTPPLELSLMLGLGIYSYVSHVSWLPAACAWKGRRQKTQWSAPSWWGYGTSAMALQAGSSSSEFKQQLDPVFTFDQPSKIHLSKDTGWSISSPSPSPSRYILLPCYVCGPVHAHTCMDTK